MATHTKTERDEQPEVTIMNINSETNPTTFRVSHNDISSPTTLLKVAQFLQAEDALIINLSLSPKHLIIVAALKDDWIQRFQLAVQEGWQPA
ncbi:hypothetical protein Hypma_009252 [Hypsizygus marmoreus]|uniref:Uncharacterized protein n=1 Tax=Hypsizygus marmoreus TaxID=39966 RepID=A0A369JST1_HYPMA|nr:hypothetical protein Hypma_009252 [Hypsizygus marmoreus]